MPMHKMMFACAFAILRDKDDAADCVQEVFTKLWFNRHRLRAIDNIQAYARSTVRNVALTMSTKSTIISNVSISGMIIDPPDTSPGPVTTLEDIDNIRAISSLLNRLPENQRHVIRLSSLAGMSNSEISASTGLSDENVRVLLSRGRKKLKNLFTRLNE